MVVRLQGNVRGSSSGSPNTVTLDSPTNGNTLIAVIGLVGSSGVSSISQDGVTWSRQKQKINAGGVINEIWLGTVGSGASTTLNVNSDCGPNHRQQVNVCEYSGIVASPLDKTSDNSGDYTTTTDTGTTATTSQGDELWIGGITACTTASPTQTSPTHDFVLFDGTAESYAYGKQSLAYLEKVVTSTGQANSGTTSESNVNWAGCIATFKVSSQSTIVVPYNGRYAGKGSKQTVVLYSSADPVIDVESNLSDITKSAVIENLIIYGNGNNTGIRLQNVYNCLIKNVTLVNCYTGIKLTATGNGWTQSNHIKHVRMAWVTHGIDFASGGTNNFAFTHIDDVGISLKDAGNQTGIYIHTDCKPYSSFIKANVWSTQTSRGMYVDGEIKYCLINLNHEKGGTTGGYGVAFGPNASIGDNQSFFVAAGNLSYAVFDLYDKEHDIVSKTY